MNHPESGLQVFCKKFVAAHVPQPHYFSSQDRSKATSAFSHMREKARGIVAGHPDTCLLVPTLPAIHVELKAPGNRPTEKQFYIGGLILAAGHLWFWADTVCKYATILVNAGVPLIGNHWALTAEHYDAILAGSAIKTLQTKRLGKLQSRPTQAQLRVIARIRAAGTEP